MTKRFKKGMIVLSCGALLALGGIALMQGGTLAAYADEGTAGDQITLDAGQGALQQTTLTLNKDGTLPALPAPVRAGWNFVGWFDGEVSENFWGDEAAENAGSLDDYKILKSQYAQGYQSVLYQGEVFPVTVLSEDADRGWKELTFNWVCMSKGNQVQEGDTVSGKTLYAMYEAERYTVYWHLNGWQNTYDTSAATTAHRTMPEYGGYFVDYELSTFPSLQWKNHSFLGWYSDADCTQEFGFVQTGAYKINAEAVTGDLHLYAKWESEVPFDGEIRTGKPLNLIEPQEGATFTINCAYTLGASKDKPVITKWESSAPDAVALLSREGTSAVFVIRNAEAFKAENRQVAIYVTVDGVAYEAASLTIGHGWGGVVAQKAPTCTEAGYTVYGCKYCGETKRVEHAADGHRLVKTNHPATCTEDAFSETECIVCGLYEKQIFENSKLGHSFVVDVIANCFGTTTITTCTQCALSETAFDENAVVHSWQSHFSTDKAPTCVDEGIQSVHCSGCGARQEITAIPATGEHVWGEWAVEREASTAEAGVKSRSCTVCGSTQSQEIPALPEEPTLPEEPEITPELPQEPTLPEEPEITLGRSEEATRPDGPKQNLEGALPEEGVAEAQADNNGPAALFGTQGGAAQAESAHSRLWLIAVAVGAAALIGVGVLVFVMCRRRNRAK